MLAVYVDESCADGKNRYLVHGALFVPGENIADLRQSLDQIVALGRIKDEIKWSGLSGAKLGRELEVVQRYFAGVSSQPQKAGERFQCLVVDQHRTDVDGFHQGDKDLCFYKFLYPLLLRRINAYAGDGETVNIVLDQRTTKRYDLDELKLVLNRGLRLKRRGAPVVRQVIYRDSKMDTLLQLSDLLTGAVGFHQNGGHFRSNSSAHKIALAQVIADSAGLPSLAIRNNRGDPLGIWTLQMQDRKKKAA